MFARVTTTLILPGKLNDDLALYRDSLVPAAKQQKG
jgi:hypothetical protein